MAKLRIVYFGTPEISVAGLQQLIADGYEIAAVVTQPDRTKGRNRRQTFPSPVKEAALEAGLPVLQPKSAKDPDFIEEVRKLEAHAFAVFAFGQILPQALLDIPELGCFNAHASLLPKWRGAAPINWAIMNGDPTTGMCIQRMVAKLDAGPVCWLKEIPLADRDTALSLSEKLAPLAGQGFHAVLQAAQSGNLSEVPQVESEATLAPILKKSDGELDWKRSAVELDRQIRGLFPWPTAYARFAAEPVRLFDAEPCNTEQETPADPGEIIQIRRDGIVVACGSGVLLLRDINARAKSACARMPFVAGAT